MLEFLDKAPYGTPFTRRVTFWFLTSFLVYIIVGFFIIPPVVKSIVKEQMSKELKRETTIERVAFNPLTFHIKVDGFRVAKKEGDGDFISVKSIMAAPAIESIWEFAPVIDYLQIQDLKIDIAFLGNGIYSITDLMGRKQEKPAPEKIKTESTVFPFSLYGFELSNATIIFDDQFKEKKHVIENLNLIVPFTSSIVDKRKEFTEPILTAVINGDPVELKGRTLPFDDTLLTEFKLGAVEVDLNQYWRYVPIKIPLQLVKGQFSSNISLFFNRPDGQRIELFLGGGGKLTNVEVVHPTDGKVATLDTLEFQMEKYSFGDNQIILNKVAVDKTYCKVIRGKGNTINWVEYFPDFGQQAPSEPGGEDKPASPFRLDIKDMSLSNAAVEWQDTVVPGGFSRVVKPLSFRIQNFSTLPDTPLKYEAKSEDSERISLMGEATIIPLGVKGKLKVTGVNIPDFKPYFHALPLQVDSGTVELAMEYEAIDTPELRNVSVKDGTLTTHDMALRIPGAKQPSLGFKSLTTAGMNFDLATKTVSVSRIELDQPMTRVIRKRDGVIDLVAPFLKKTSEQTSEMATVPTPAPALDEETSKPSGTPWTASINEIRLTKGTSHFRDNTLKNPAYFSIKDLRVNLDNITTVKGEAAKYDISCLWGGGGHIATLGNLQLDTLASRGQIKLRSFGLKPFDSFVSEFTELILADGSVNTDIKYDFSGLEKMRYAVEGDVGLHDLHIKDNWGDGHFAGLKSFTIAGTKFTNDPNQLTISQITLDGPQGMVEFDENGYLNIMRAFRIPAPKAEDDKEAKKEQKKQTPPPAKIKAKKEKAFFDKFEIDAIVVKNGQLSFRDGSVTPEFTTDITDMTLDLREVSQTPDSRPKVEFNAKLGPAPMTVSGVVNPVITPIYSDLLVSIGGMEMVPLTPYTVEYLGYPIEKGRMHADVNFKTENWALNATNKFFVEQLVLGPKDDNPDAPNIPVKFGLALLQDNNGDMELNLPISGRLDDPDFKIGGIIFKAIATLFVKALASPFTLIGSMFGGQEEMDFVTFKQGSHEVDASNSKKLESLTKVLKDRAKLTLEVDGVIDPEADTKGLMENRFNEKLKLVKYESLTRKERSATTADAMSINPEEYEDILFEVYADEPDPEDIKTTTFFITDRQPVDIMERFVKERIIVTEEDLNELAQQRATAVKELLIEKEPTLASRIYLLDKRTKKTAKKGVTLHRADLSIK